MQVADAATVKGDFNDTTFSYAGTVTRFSRRDGKFFVTTDGPAGAMREYQIAYTFGTYPLQQYLVAFPGGRYQALSVCWDTRPKAEGGQRWFHLYPKERVRAGDVLHWTSLSQNWNYQCAECHSTNLRKGYQLSADRYETTWSEINVSCEACHGPGSRHLEWARATPEAAARLSVPNKGLVFDIGVGDRGVWTINPATGIAERNRPRTSRMEIETCARCHARRGTLTDAYRHGRPLADTHRPAVLEESLYFADGQIHDEVYEYGSFLQSKMFAKGVTCSDCHDPHELGMGSQPDEVCSRCHLPAKFAAPAHHHHRVGSAGSSCVVCHMPARTYMVVDSRRDHSFRVPRPDLTDTLGTPNACTTCHAAKPASWAADIVRGWFGSARASQPTYASSIYAGRTLAADAEQQLAASATDPATPAIARATALSLLSPVLSPRSLPAVEAGLRDADPLPRAAAIEALSAADQTMRARLLGPLLVDPVRLVRIDAARAAASLPPGLLTPEQEEARRKGLEEFTAVQQEQADAPGSHINLGALYVARGEYDRARAEFEIALKIQPAFVPAAINLADLSRIQGRDDEGERVLRNAIERTPDQADLFHALGLVLVRTKRQAEALDAFQRAAKLRPTDRRLQYVLAVALYSSGRTKEALDLLERTARDHPGDRDVLSALVSYHRDLGHVDRALDYARRLEAALPTDSSVRSLVAQLEAAVQGR